MSRLKTGLMYNELSNKVYCGTINQDTGIARAGKKDVTSDFIGVMLQKFPVGFKQNIECNGKVEAVVIVVDEEKSHKYSCVNEMYEMLESIFNIEHERGGSLGVDGSFHYKVSEDVFKKVGLLLEKARGE